MIQNFIEFVRNKTHEFEKKVFLHDIETDRSITYNQFDNITSQLSYGFKKLGLRKGDHVALLHPNSSDFILCYIGVIKAGGVIVPINSIYAPREIQFILNDSEAKILVTVDVLFEKIENYEVETPFLKKSIIREDEQTLEETLAKKVGTLTKKCKNL